MSTAQTAPSLATLHIDIDGEWMAVEMSELLDICVSLYYFQALASEFRLPFFMRGESNPAFHRPLEYLITS